MFYQLLRCPVCRAARSGPLGCCARCAASLFSPTIGTFELSLGPYSGPLEQAIRAYKFQQVRRLGLLSGKTLADTLRAAGWQPDLICAVPLHPLRHMQRGYNQSALVAEVTARHTSLPYRPLLRRVRTTQQQARLGAVARQRNVAGAFRCTSLSGEQVLLVDDVMTSGATITECALTLFAAGAGRVYVATLARVIRT